MSNSYFDRFFEEKDLPYQAWEITADNGVVHFIDSDVVIEAIKAAPENEQAAIKNTLVRLDFVNADIMDYLRFLAGALVNIFSQTKEITNGNQKR